MSYANIDKTLNIALTKLRNAYPNESKIRTLFWNRQLEIDLDNMEFQPELDIVSKILISHYLTSKARITWDGQWLSFKELPDGEIYNVPFHKRTIVPLLKIVGNDLNILMKLKEKLGGNLGEFGDLMLVFNPLPNLYLAYIYWLGDDEFPPNANILFSSNFPAYLPTEDCVILASSIIWQLKNV